MLKREITTLLQNMENLMYDKASAIIKALRIDARSQILRDKIRYEITEGLDRVLRGKINLYTKTHIEYTIDIALYPIYMPIAEFMWCEYDEKKSIKGMVP